MASDVGGAIGTKLGRGQWIGLILGLVLFALFMLMPPIAPLTPLGMRSIAVLLLFAVWLATTPMPLYATCLFVLALYVVTGVVGADKTWSYFGHWVNLFLIGAFALGGNLGRTGVARRIALWACGLSFIQGKPWAFFTVFLLTAGLSSLLFTSPILTVIVFTTIIIGFLTSLGVQRGDRFAGLLVLATTWASTAGGQIAPYTSIATLLAIGIIQKQTGYQIQFLQWLAAGLVGFFATFVIILLTARFIARVPAHHLAAAMDPTVVKEEKAKQGPMSSGERAAIASMVVAMIFWFLPDVVSMTVGGALGTALKALLPYPAVALVIAALGTLIPVTIGGERRMLLTWREWTGSLEWGLLTIVATGIALGDIMSNTASGIPDFVLTNVGGLVQAGGGEWLLVGLIVVLGCLLTEPLSNLALVSILLPIGVGVSMATHIGNPVAMALAASMAYSQSFALPLSPLIAVAYGTGWVNPKDAIKLGFFLDIAVALALALIVYPVAKLFIPVPW